MGVGKVNLCSGVQSQHTGMLIMHYHGKRQTLCWGFLTVKHSERQGKRGPSS